jgi:glycosyltransferase involved in cell wall biosynthesis
MKPSVSVIIPCKDRPQHLMRALASVREQTVLPGEVIVVDDGSEPPLMLDSGGAVPVKLIRQRNSGPSAARNRGIQEASGDWIALLDSDDTWLPDKLETQLRLIARYEGAGFCVCDMVVHGRPAVVEFPFVPPDGAPDGLIEDALERLLPGHYIHTSGVMFRKDVFTAVGRFDESLWYCEDRDLWLRLAAATEVVATTRRLSEYYREGESLSVHENTTVESIVAIYILDKMIESDLFERRIKEQAAAMKGEVLNSLSYWYRKEGRPLKCCRASLASLRAGGAVAPNLKNLFYCWPELLLRGLPRRLARRPQPVKNDAWVRAISK